MSPDTTTLSERLSGYLRTLEEDGRIRSRWVPGTMIRTLKGQGRRRMCHHGGGLFHMCGGGVWSDDGVGLDLDNPLTVLGALLIFREASGDEGAHTYWVAPGCWEVRWRVPGSTEQRIVDGGVTEAHALVNAFEVLVNEILGV